MPSTFTIAAALLAVYASTYLYALIKNIWNARKTGLPCICVPIDQQNIFWMLTSPTLRSWYEQRLPKLIFGRLTLAIYGWEFFERLNPYVELCGPQADLRTYVLATCGRLEMHTSNAEIVTQVLARPRDFMQLEIASFIMGLFGSNILTSDGDHWARQRKVVATVINERVSKAVFKESVAQTQGLLEELSAGQRPRDTTETNQLFNMAKKIAINVLSAAGMGAPVPWHDDTDERPKPGFKLNYIQCVKTVINSVGGPIILPLWFLRNYPSFLPGHKVMHDLGVAKKEFPVHTMDLLEKERLRSRSEGSATKSNVLSQLLQASERPIDSDLKALKFGDAKALSDEEMVGNLFVFTAAGFDTTANTISYALVLLARHPKWQDWLLEEIDEILPASTEIELDYVAIYPKAIRVMAFMLETLRHFTPLVHISKQTKTAQTIQTSTGSYWLPANTTVYINTIALHGDPVFWRGMNALPDEKLEEQDEWQFRPTRWINPPGSSQPLFQPPRGAFVPWSAGPRVCPGQKMAQVEFTAIFLTLLRQHRIDAVPLHGESRSETEARLDGAMRNSMSILTTMMKDVYDVTANSNKGLKMGLTRRR